MPKQKQPTQIIRLTDFIVLTADQRSSVILIDQPIEIPGDSETPKKALQRVTEEGLFYLEVQFGHQLVRFDDQEGAPIIQPHIGKAYIYWENPDKQGKDVGIELEVEHRLTLD